MEKIKQIKSGEFKDWSIRNGFLESPLWSGWVGVFRGHSRRENTCFKKAVDWFCLFTG